MSRSVRKQQAGFVGGFEALAFGVLVFVIGTSVMINGWAVVDAKFATNAAAREAVRAVVETPAVGPPTAASLHAVALSAARQAAAAHGHDAAVVDIAVQTPSGELAQVRCAPVRIRASIEVRAIILPGISGPALRTVSSTHEEVVDPFRSGLAARDGLGAAQGNPCGF